MEKYKKLGIIQQGFKEIKMGSLIKDGYIIGSILVPTKKIKEFEMIRDSD